MSYFAFVLEKKYAIVFDTTADSFTPAGFLFTHVLHINNIFNNTGMPESIPERPSMKHLFLLFAAAAALICTACSTPTVTNTARNSVEEMLLSSVVERGISSINF